MSHARVGAAILATAFAVLCAPANAAFPGKNGRIFFYNDGPRSIQPDGSGEASLPFSDARALAWSPDGSRVAFTTKSTPDECCLLKVANADGTDVRTLFDGHALGDDPNNPSPGDGVDWSPDGTQIVSAWKVFYVDLEGEAAPVLMITDVATGDTRFLVRTGLWTAGLSWSPRGDRIAFWGGLFGSGSAYGIYTIRPDGTGREFVAGTREISDGDGPYDPEFSPDGTKLAATWEGPTGYLDVIVMNPDGSGTMYLTDPADDASDNYAPQWSPDGSQIAFYRDVIWPPDGVYIMNADGSGQALLAPAELREPPYSPPYSSIGPPDWQPIPINSYPRPAGATTIRASLVPAYRICDPDQATLSHGPPLAHSSCASPALTSGYLTLGTEDANGHPAESRGLVRVTRIGETPVDTTNGDQADVRYELQLTDVRWASDLSDYTGDLKVEVPLRFTDKDNTPSPFPTGAATVSDTSLSFTAPCTPTAETTTGASCAISTTADALVPETVKEAKRAVWQFGKIRVLDGGADGDTATGPNTVFAAQGLFVP